MDLKKQFISLQKDLWRTFGHFNLISFSFNFDCYEFYKLK